MSRNIMRSEDVDNVGMRTRRSTRSLDDRWPEQADSNKSLYVMLGGLAALVVCVAIGCLVWIQKSSSSSAETDEIMREAKAEAEQEKNRAEGKRIADQRRRGAAEREELAKKEKAEKEREEAERKRKEAEEIARAEAESKKIVEDAKKKASEDAKKNEEKTPQTKKSRSVTAFGELAITSVIYGGVMRIGVGDFFEIASSDFGNPAKTDRYDHVFAKYAPVITNENSIEVYYLHDGEVESSTCHYRARAVPKIGASKPKVRFMVEGWPERASSSPWAIYRVVNLAWPKEGNDASLAVFWVWNGALPPKRLFESEDEVDLKQVCFGCDAAYDLYASSRKVAYSVLRVHGRVRCCLTMTSPLLTIDMYAVDERKIAEEVRKYKAQQEELEAAIVSQKRELETASSWRAEKGNDNRGLKEKEIEKKEFLKNLKKEKKIMAMRKQIEQLQKKIDEVQHAVHNWKNDIRNSEFVVTVIEDNGNLTEGKEIDAPDRGGF